MPNRKTALADPLGPKEVAEFLGVQRATVQQWSFRRVLPERDYTVGGFPAWERRTIVLWALETDRLEPTDERVTAILPKSEVARIEREKKARADARASALANA